MASTSPRLSFFGSSFEPALLDRALKREPAPAATSPYGACDAVLGTLVGQPERGPDLLGERFSAADVPGRPFRAMKKDAELAPKPDPAT